MGSPGWPKMGFRSLCLSWGWRSAWHWGYLGLEECGAFREYFFSSGSAGSECESCGARFPVGSDAAMEEASGPRGKWRCEKWSAPGWDDGAFWPGGGAIKDKSLLNRSPY